MGTAKRVKGQPNKMRFVIPPQPDPKGNRAERRRAKKLGVKARD